MLAGGGCTWQAHGEGRAKQHDVQGYADPQRACKARSLGHTPPHTRAFAHTHMHTYARAPFPGPGAQALGSLLQGLGSGTACSTGDGTARSLPGASVSPGSVGDLEALQPPPQVSACPCVFLNFPVYAACLPGP